MLIIPAIDLKDGQAVRLQQGRMEASTVFGTDPVAVAQRWVELGARRLHLVDLDGAFAGKPVNHRIIEQIVRRFPGLPVQIGGGIRTLATIETYLAAGAQKVILGTKAVMDPDFVRAAARAHPERVIAGLDARDGKAAIAGWAEQTDLPVLALAQQLQEAGVCALIYTDIARDGMLSGVNVQATAELARQLTIPVIASGGISQLDDIRALAAVAHLGIMGAISGRALYEGTLDFHAAQALADQLAETRSWD